MTDAQKATEAANTARKEFRALALTEDATADQIAEANKKLDDLEARAEALGKTEEAEVVKTEPTEDSETRERRELRGKARLTNYVVAAMRGRQVDGAEAEFSDACEVRGEIPLDLFQPDPRAAAEERVVTSAPGTVGVKVAAIQPHIFAPSIAPYLVSTCLWWGLGLSARRGSTRRCRLAPKPRVPPPPRAPRRSPVKSATPKRVSARLELLAEDIAAAGVSNFETALQQNLTMALSAELDKQVIVGAGAGNDLEGLLHGLAAAGADGTTLTFQHGITKMAALVDGLWATETAHIRQIVGVATVPPGGWRVRRVRQQQGRAAACRLPSGSVRRLPHE